MQGFFVLTGYTTNFEKSFKSYIISNIKLLVIPWLSFSIITRLLSHIVFNKPFVESITGDSYFFLFEDYWFIHALLFSKIAYFFIRKYLKTDLFRALVLLFMMVIGFYSIVYYYRLGYENPYHVNNYFHYKDFLCMAFFLWVGDFIKRKELLKRIKWWGYVCITILYLCGHAFRLYERLNGYEIPELSPVILSHSSNIVSLFQIPAYLFFVIMGCLSCFGIVMFIKECKLLEYFGKNSLIVYCGHFFILDIYISIINRMIIPNTMINAILFTIIVLTLTLITIAPLVKILSIRPYSYLIGKF